MVRRTRVGCLLLESAPTQLFCNQFRSWFWSSGTDSVQVSAAITEALNVAFEFTGTHTPPPERASSRESGEGVRGSVPRAPPSSPAGHRGCPETTRA